MQPVAFEDVRPLFHRPLDAPEVAAFLARHPEHRVGKPSEGSQFVVFRPHGFDLLFQALPGSPGRRPPRVLTTVFLFQAGDEKHAPFPRPPFGIAFGDSRDALLQKFGPSFETSVPILGVLCWETWRVEDLRVYARYENGTLTARHFIYGHSDIVALLQAAAGSDRRPA